MAAFHSAVNRIPVPRASAMRLAEKGVLCEKVFGEHTAIGHDHLGAERWSGSIRLVITAMAPLVVGEQHTSTTGQEASTISVTMDSGKAVVPATMIKGMLSRAYETVTASRFRVFGTHDAPLTYRADAASALSLVPLRVTGTRDDGGLDAELLLGAGLDEYPYQWGDYRPAAAMRAGLLQDGVGGRCDLVLRGGFGRLDAMTQHEQRVRCRFALCVSGNPKEATEYAFWQLTHITTTDPDGNDRTEEVFRLKPDVHEATSVEGVGYVYRTAPDGHHSKNLFDKKKNERVFFATDNNPPRSVTIPSEVADAYRTVATSYSDLRREEAKSGRPGPLKNRVTCEVRAGGHPGLRLESLAWALLAPECYTEGGAVAEEQELKVVELVPTMIGRRAYHASPRVLAEDQRVAPLSSSGEASAADRLFGYVVDPPADEAAGGDVALRGRVRVGSVDTSRVRVSHGSHLLAPLLSPKPSSARRFLTDQAGKPVMMRKPADGDVNERRAPSRRELYQRGQMLGAAAFPVHRDLLEQVGIPVAATTVLPTQGGKVAGPSVRMRVMSWIETGSVLSCTVWLDDVSVEELAVLTWLLTPTNLVPAAQQEAEPGAEGFLRLGLGKPLGLGVVKVEIPPDGIRMVRGSDLASDYLSLRGCCGLPSGEVSMPPDTDVTEKFNRLPWVQAMQRAAYGYADGVEVRYMRLQENERNNEINNKTRRPAQGKGQSPSSLIAEHPSPLDV